MKKIFLLALILRVVLAFVVWHPDLNNHIDWGIRFYEYGPAKFYAPESNVWSYTWPNQPPGTIYIFAFMRKVYEAIYSFFWFINTNLSVFPSKIMFFIEDNLYPALLKLPAILADLGIAYLIFLFIRDAGGNLKKAKYGALLFLFNPVVWYNSAVWGQTDSEISFLVLLSFFWLFRNKMRLSMISFMLSLYVKISLAIFLPVYLLVIFKRKKVRVALISFVFALIMVSIFTLPFTKDGSLTYLYEIYTKKVLTQQLHIITANAFNLWALIAGIHEKPHSLMLGPMQYKYWGYLLFSFFLFWEAIAVFRKPDQIQVFKSLMFIAFGAFLFLTNMHERYLYPFFPYFTILTILYSGNLIFYIIISLINLLNLYNFWWVPKIGLVVSMLSFGDRLMPRMLGGASVILFLLLFFRFEVKSKLNLYNKER